MIEFLHSLFHELNIWLLLLLFVLPFIGTLILVPWFVIRLPADYFQQSKRGSIPWGIKHPLLRALYLIGKNLLGVLVLLTGIAMLVLPGQGLLTVLAGMLLLDFPGKFQCERWLVSRRPVLKAINWLRSRRQRPPLAL